MKRSLSLLVLLSLPAGAVCPEASVAVLTCGQTVNGQVDPGPWTGANPAAGCDDEFNDIGSDLGAHTCDDPSGCFTWACTAGDAYVCPSPAIVIDGEGPEDVYDFVCPPSGTADLALTGVDCDLDLYVLTADCNPTADCIFARQASGLANESGTVNCIPGETLNLVVEGGGFTARQHFESTFFGLPGYCDTHTGSPLGSYTLAVDCAVVEIEDCDTVGDEDNDGDADCADSDCFAEAFCCDDDGDGFIDIACGGGDCDDTVFNAPGTDSDNDDVVDTCDNCPNTNNAGQADSDGDGVGNACDVCPAVDDNGDGDGDGVICALDCDDGDGANYPGNSEQCDGQDNDCDAMVDENLGTVDYWPDLDGDGFGDASGTVVSTCNGPPPNTSASNTDCDDSDPVNYPGNGELCDGQDNDCDGMIDENIVDSDYWPDLDGDGFGNVAGPVVTTCDGAPPNTAATSTDCDDTAADTFPVAPELPDGRDNDCDGLVDETTQRYDDDGDGFTEIGGDCDDGDATVSPTAVETCDGIDEDCDGIPDDNTTCRDDDGDGYCEGPGACLSGIPGDCNDGDAAVSPGVTEVPGNGIDDDCDGAVDSDVPDPDGDGVSQAAGDCDPNEATVFPGAPELADGLDNDCDGVVDEGTASFDDDGDGATENGGDCHDGDPEISPAATEVANGIDDDCDGAIDEGTEAGDDDGDGFTELGGDCDDGDPAVTPGAPELANGIDDDCDGQIDEDLSDRDRDGYTTDDDCDDEDGFVNPGIAEICDDRIDNDCDGEVDEGCDGPDPIDPIASKCSHTGAGGWVGVFGVLLFGRRR